MKSKILHPVTVGMVLLIGVFIAFAYQENQRETIRFGHYEIMGLVEPSGLVRSRSQLEIFWTHNDSGGAPEVFATSATGALLGRFDVVGAEARDWESITTDKSGHLYIGDIGNNANTREDLVVYKVREPTVDVHSTVGEAPVLATFPFFYPEQTAFPDLSRMNYDAEALFWATHPKTGQGTLYILTKHRSDDWTTMYRFEHLRDGERQPLTQVGAAQLPGKDDGGLVTGVALTEDEHTLAVLSYGTIHLFQRPKQGDDYLSNPTHRITLDTQLARQAEALEWDGDALLFTNEQLDIFRIERPMFVDSAP